MYDHILLPTDASESVAEAYDHAIRLAKDHDATVHALYVTDKRRYLGASDEVQADLRQSLEEEGERAVAEIARLAGDAGLDVVTEIREGIPATDILQYVEEADIDVVVMGTHGRTGRDKLTSLGSVTERVLKNAEVPLFVIDVGSENE